MLGESTIFSGLTLGMVSLLSSSFFFSASAPSSLRDEEVLLSSSSAYPHRTHSSCGTSVLQQLLLHSSPPGSYA